MFERRPRIVTTTHVQGKTLDEMLNAATKRLDLFFNKHPYEIIEFEARPVAQAMGGQVFVWEAEVEAGEVYA